MFLFSDHTVGDNTSLPCDQGYFCITFSLLQSARLFEVRDFFDEPLGAYRPVDSRLLCSILRWLYAGFHLVAWDTNCLFQLVRNFLLTCQKKSLYLTNYHRVTGLLLVQRLGILWERSSSQSAVGFRFFCGSICPIYGSPFLSTHVSIALLAYIHLHLPSNICMSHSALILTIQFQSGLTATVLI